MSGHQTKYEKRITKAFALCSYSWANKGDAALLISLHQALEHVFGTVDMPCTSMTPELDARAYGRGFLRMPLPPDALLPRAIHAGGRRFGLQGIVPYLTALHAGSFVALFRLWTRLYDLYPETALTLLPDDVKKVVREVISSDISIAVPGGYLMAPSKQDDYWLYHWALLSIPLLLGRPLVLYSCSIGPFSGFHARFAQWLFGRTDHVMVRELRSKEELLALGVRPDKISLAPDAAFAFRADPEGVAELQRVAGDIERYAKPRLGISVRFHGFPGSPDATGLLERYFKEVARTADMIVEAGGTPIFVPQVIEVRHSDVDAARRVIAEMQHGSRAILIDADMSPSALQALYGRLDVLVGTRMHANILALTQRTPVVAIAYEHKTTGIMDMLGMSEYCVQIDEVTGRVAEKTQLALTNRDRIRSRLRDTIPRIEAEARDAPHRLLPFLR